MINFEEELAKFKPSLEVDETEKAILQRKTRRKGGLNQMEHKNSLQELMNEIKK